MNTMRDAQQVVTRQHKTATAVLPAASAAAFNAASCELNSRSITAVERVYNTHNLLRWGQLQRLLLLPPQDCRHTSSTHHQDWLHLVAGKKKTRGMVVRRPQQPLGWIGRACLDRGMCRSPGGPAHAGVLSGFLQRSAFHGWHLQ